MRIAHTRRSLVTYSLLTAALIGAACTVFDEAPSIVPGLGNDGGSDSGPDGGGGKWWSFTTDDENRCESEGVPSLDDRPASNTDGPNVAGEIYLAMTSLRLGRLDAPGQPGTNEVGLTENRQAWRGIGLDLDRSCTNSETCKDSAGDPVVKQYCLSANPSQVIPDARNCRDNAVGNSIEISAAVPAVAGLFGVYEPDWNCEIRRGGFGIVFRLRDYNGQPNDPSVQVDIYNSTGTVQPENTPCRFKGNIATPERTLAGDLNPNWRTSIEWDINDRWKIVDSSVDPDDISSGIKDAKMRTKPDAPAFVRDGYLFATFETPEGSPAEISMIGTQPTQVPGFRLQVYRPVLVGQLFRDPAAQNLWRLKDATLAGAVKPDDMIKGFREIGYCENMCSSYSNLETVLRGFPDLYTDPSRPPSENRVDAPCDGMSIGLGIEAREAKVDDQLAPDIDRTECQRPRHPEAPTSDCRCENGQAVCGAPDGGTSEDGGT